MDEIKTTRAYEIAMNGGFVHPDLAIIRGRFDDDDLWIGILDRGQFIMSDGDCFDLEEDGTLDGYAAELLTFHQLEKKLLSLERKKSALKEVLSLAVKALSDGLWDYGPGQDEHDKCNEVIAQCKTVLEEP